MSEILWMPSKAQAHSSNIWQFTQEVSARRGLSLNDYHDLWDWSVERPEEFWPDLWDFCGIIAETRGDRVVTSADDIITARFFPDARLSFAQNLLRDCDDEPACVLWREDGYRRQLTRRELHAEVSRARQLLLDLDVESGDRVAAYLPNIPEALIFMLATVSLGAIWSSCSPDFGVQGTLDRIGQIDPKVLIAVDGYDYGGKRFALAERITSIVEGLPTLDHVIVVDYVHEPTFKAIRAKFSKSTLSYPEAVGGYDPQVIEFESLPFDHPAFVLYTSGTTGKPKCIVHGAGRALLKLVKEHVLHFDVKRGDRFFYFTTTGWNMWHTLVTTIAAGGVAVIYDGLPFYPRKDTLFDVVDAERIAQFGVSPKYLEGLAKEGMSPISTHDLASLRTVLSTGAPLSPASFDYVYANIKKDVRLSSISGGTEIVATLVNGNPLGPVRRGELQVPALGMKTEVFDEKGRAVIGEKGELVCTAPFPSRPLCFWNDPDDRRYHETYFSRFSNVWCHGDFAEVTPNGGFIIYGRSDATLNPGGIRIGTADIYRPVESLDTIVDSLVVGQRIQEDEQVVLFVKLRPGLALDDDLRQSIRNAVRSFASPRHVPAEIVQVDDIPYTINGKKLELAVRDILHGRPVRNASSIANPQALDAIRAWSKVRG